MYLVTEWFGTFLLDDRGRPVAKTLFPKDAEALAALALQVDAGKVLDEERALAPRDGAPFEVAEVRLLQLPGARLSRDPARVPRAINEAESQGYDRGLLHATALAFGRDRVRQAVSGRDLHVVQAVDTIDELAAQANVLVERLREWYALHYPELVYAIARNEELAAVVSQYGNADAIRAAKPEYAALETRMGGLLLPPEEAAVRGLARAASTLYSTRADLEKYLDGVMPEIAPSLTTLLGAVLSARMIKQAGGLRRLATMPAGTVQTLGAEKALFRHIKEGKRPPKHGILFQHPTLHRAPRWQRGALARSLAAKAVLAARADAFTHDASAGARLLAEFEARARDVSEERRKPRKAPARAYAPAGPERGASRGGPPMQRGPPPRGPPREYGPPRGPPREHGGPAPRYGGGAPGGGGRGGSGGPPQGGRRPFSPRGPPRGGDRRFGGGGPGGRPGGRGGPGGGGGGGGKPGKRFHGKKGGDRR